MLTNLNEKYLLEFISKPDFYHGENRGELLDVLSSMGVKIKFRDPNPVYDLIDKFEYAGIFYE